MYCQEEHKNERKSRNITTLETEKAGDTAMNECGYSVCMVGNYRDKKQRNLMSRFRCSIRRPALEVNSSR